MRELSLFTGAGGGVLGSKLLGWETIGYVEWNDYCQRVLKTCNNSWWATEPELGRVANGVASRVDRLKALGNGQVPAVVRAAWTLIYDY